MILPDEVQFRNCFDKAILLMIKRGMDVKELVNSHLFYCSLWPNKSLFSSSKAKVVLPYNGDIEDLEIEDPNLLFRTDDQPERKSKKQKVPTSPLEKMKAWFMDEGEFSKHQEQFEMQYNYIYMEKIQGENKQDVSSTLKDCEDIDLFEQEPIQHIIDYKWDTYARQFFLLQFILYALFLITFYADVNIIYYTDDEGNRIKDF